MIDSMLGGQWWWRIPTNTQTEPSRSTPTPETPSPSPSPSPRGRTLLALLFLPLLACDPHMDIRGRVLADDGTPRANVIVALECPQETWLRASLTVQTNAVGEFRIEGLGCPTRSCRVSAQAPDGGAFEVKLAPFCTASTYHCRDSCSAASVELRDESGGGGGSEGEAERVYR